VGHIARLLEEGGIPTVVIASAVFEERMNAMQLPRLVLTHQMMGRTLGAPGDKDTQRAAIRMALELLMSAKTGGQVQYINSRSG
jgi:hypothetical protein